LAVVVGVGTAFGVHVYLESDPDLRLGLLDRIAGRSESAASEPASLELIRKTNEEVFRLAGSGDSGAASPEAPQLHEQLDRAYAELAQALSGDEAQLSELRVSTLHGKYAAVRIDRDWFAKPFLEFADRLIAECSTGPEAGQAAMLRIVVQHDLRRPPTRDLLEDLDRFALSHPPSLGTMAYCLTAQELVQNNQSKAAETVLRHGIQTYRSTPVAGTLVNQLVDLGLSDAAAPGITQIGWNALSRMYESRAESNRQDACGPRSKSKRT
jgi:hypothetical protein